MALDPTAQEQNIRSSLKKFFKEELGANNIPVLFDRNITDPYTPSVSGTMATKWVTVSFGPLDLQGMSDFSINVTCFTRQDSEGVELSKLKDLVLSLLVDEEQTDSCKRIDLFDVSCTPWRRISSFLVIRGRESKQFEVVDGTKAKILPVRLKWGAAI